MTVRARRVRSWTAGAVAGGVLAGCVYFNSYYNAQRIYGDAEADRLAGRTDQALARYDSVIQKAADAYRKEPEGSWADDALFLLGRAYLRSGDLTGARGAFEAAREATDDERIGMGSELYLGAVALLEGDRTNGVRRLNEAIRRLPPGPLRAEGHLWRGRHFLALGYFGSGWWDLDRAAEADPRLEVEADLQRVASGIRAGDSLRARLGTARLLERDQAHIRADTLVRLIEDARDRWGAETAVAFLDPLAGSGWPPEERDRLRLLRGRLLLAAGDTAAAMSALEDIAGGTGGEAVEARLYLAHLTLAAVERVEELDRVRPVLLPASADPRVVDLLESVRKVELLDERAVRQGSAMPLFAAAEASRDVLGAPGLARAFLLAFARHENSRPWDGKAVLAALELSRSTAEEREVRVLLSEMDGNPYVRAARTGWFPAAEFRRLEETLRSELRRLMVEVTAEAVQRDVLIRSKPDTLG